MAKVKLMRFELIALFEESKKITEYLQRFGAAEIENTELEQLSKYNSNKITSLFEQTYNKAIKAAGVLEKYCEIKKSLIQSFTDYTFIEYDDYKQFCDRADKVKGICDCVCRLNDEIEQLNAQIIKKQTLIDYYKPWENLDIPMSSSRTASTSIFIGTFGSELTSQDILNLLAGEIPEVDGIEVQTVNTSKLQTSAVILCHHSDAQMLSSALKKIGFSKPDFPAKKLPKAAIS
ncbi:MAG: hypothetical protein ACI4W6_00865, partial [Acutalibacteraceae bacterium]